MARAKHVDIAKSGAREWNRWRAEYPDVLPSLSLADLRGVDLAGADLHGADLRGANLGGTNLTSANLDGANLNGATLQQALLIRAKLFGANMKGANLRQADLTLCRASHGFFHSAILDSACLMRATLRYATMRRAHLVAANLREAHLYGLDLTSADLSHPDLTQADLSRSRLISTRLVGAQIDSCRIYGISAWDVNLQDTSQSRLIISPQGTAPITVDNLEVAQVVYLLMNNRKFRDVLTTMATKVVLILGQFSEKRKQVLDAIRAELCGKDLIPVIFDFEGPQMRDASETVSTIAHLSRFIIADITDPRSVPLELQLLAPTLRVPIILLLEGDDAGFSMVKDLMKYPWVLPVHRYLGLPALRANLDGLIADASELMLMLQSS